MRIVFFGSSEFAVESLKKIASEHALVAVVTQPDRKKGRHLHLAMTPVKICAQQLAIPVLQPQDVSSDQAVIELKKFDADLFVVVSFGQILSRRVLDVPKLYSINLHASLLPRWRGASPINRAIMSKDKQTGVTIIKMNEYMDAGDILLAKTINIADKSPR